MPKKKRVAVRRHWKIHPATRVQSNKKTYNRTAEKKNIRKLLVD